MIDYKSMKVEREGNRTMGIFINTLEALNKELNKLIKFISGNTLLTIAVIILSAFLLTVILSKIIKSILRRFSRTSPEVLNRNKAKTFYDAILLPRFNIRCGYLLWPRY